MTLAFSCAPEVLKRLADRVGNIVANKPNVPILSNLMLADDGEGRLAVTATDLDVTAIATSAPGEVEIERAGATTVPSGILRDFLKKCDKVDRLHFVSDETHSTIRAGRTVFRMIALPADDFPTTKVFENGVHLSLTAPQLRRIYDACWFAICSDEARYNLCGIYLHAAETHPGFLTSVATDGHRLSLLRQAVEGDVAAMPRAIVPRKACAQFKTIADAAGDLPIIVGVSDKRIVFHAGELQILSRLIEGTFPDYDRVIPKGQTHNVQIEREPLLQSVQRVATVPSERGSAVRCEFEDAALVMSTKSGDDTLGRDEIEIANATFLKIGLNVRFLVSILESFDTHGLEIALADPGTAALFRAPGDDSRLAVLMPMRA